MSIKTKLDNTNPRMCSRSRCNCNVAFNIFTQFNGPGKVLSNNKNMGVSPVQQGRFAKLSSVGLSSNETIIRTTGLSFFISHHPKLTSLKFTAFYLHPKSTNAPSEIPDRAAYIKVTRFFFKIKIVLCSLLLSHFHCHRIHLLTFDKHVAAFL
jgi:hypothetical protein